MDLNPSKCHSISFSKKRAPITFAYVIADTTLTHVSTSKDLGVLMDSTLSFRAHINEVVSRGLKMLGFVKRCTKDFTSLSAIRLLYCTLIRPLLEYASSVWNPIYACHIHSLEQVQRKFLRYMAFKAGIHPIEGYRYDYSILYERFSLAPLKVRREHRDLKNLYNIYHSTFFCPDLLQSIGILVPSRNTRSHQLFLQPFCRTNVRYNTFTSRSVRLANNLSPYIDFSVNKKNFVRFIRDFHV